MLGRTVAVFDGRNYFSRVPDRFRPGGAVEPDHPRNRRAVPHPARGKLDILLVEPKALLLSLKRPCTNSGFAHRWHCQEFLSALLSMEVHKTHNFSSGVWWVPLSYHLMVENRL